MENRVAIFTTLSVSIADFIYITSDFKYGLTFFIECLFSSEFSGFFLYITSWLTDNTALPAQCIRGGPHIVIYGREQFGVKSGLKDVYSREIGNASWLRLSYWKSQVDGIEVEGAKVKSKRSLMI